MGTSVSPCFTDTYMISNHAMDGVLVEYPSVKIMFRKLAVRKIAIEKILEVGPGTWQIILAAL
jgi:hypothetical protein